MLLFDVTFEPDFECLMFSALFHHICVLQFFILVILPSFFITHTRTRTRTRTDGHTDTRVNLCESAARVDIAYTATALSISCQSWLVGCRTRRARRSQEAAPGPCRRCHPFGPLQLGPVVAAASCASQQSPAVRAASVPHLAWRLAALGQ